MNIHNITDFLTALTDLLIKIRDSYYKHTQVIRDVLYSVLHLGYIKF